MNFIILWILVGIFSLFFEMLCFEKIPLKDFDLFDYICTLSFGIVLGFFALPLVYIYKQFFYKFKG